MKSKKYTYFSERNYAGKGYKIDEKVVDYWKKVLGDNVFNNIEKVYKISPEIIISDKDFELAAEPKEILQLSELFHKGLGKNVKYKLKIGEQEAFVFDRFFDYFIKFGIALFDEQDIEIDECTMDNYIDNMQTIVYLYAAEKLFKTNNIEMVYYSLTKDIYKIVPFDNNCLEKIKEVIKKIY